MSNYTVPDVIANAITNETVTPIIPKKKSHAGAIAGGVVGGVVAVVIIAAGLWHLSRKRKIARQSRELQFGPSTYVASPTKKWFSSGSRAVTEMPSLPSSPPPNYPVQLEGGMSSSSFEYNECANDLIRL